jgi:hypothetical protein
MQHSPKIEAMSGDRHLREGGTVRKQGFLVTFRNKTKAGRLVRCKRSIADAKGIYVVWEKRRRLGADRG